MVRYSWALRQPGELTASAAPKNGQFGFGTRPYVWETLISRVQNGGGGGVHGGRKADAVSPQT